MKEIRLLNRIVRRTSFGYEWEADPRHSEIIISSMGAEEANFVTTPGVHLKTIDTDQEEIPPHEATTYRVLAARANFLSLDRGDIQFSAKEICRRMAKRRRCDWGKIKRLARYLKGAPRMVLSYPWQNMSNVITAIVDTDFAGCLETRRSTSGGLVRRGATYCVIGPRHNRLLPCRLERLSLWVYAAAHPQLLASSLLLATWGSNGHWRSPQMHLQRLEFAVGAA